MKNIIVRYAGGIVSVCWSVCVRGKGVGELDGVLWGSGGLVGKE